MNKTTRRFLLAFFVALAISIFIHGSILRKYTIYDDAYITYRYSKNLVNGFGPVWNIGEYVEGYTSFLHMILMAGVIAIRRDPARISQGLSLICLALISALGYLRLTKKPDPLAKISGVSFLLYFASCPAMLAWSFHGMETVIFAALVFGTTLALESELRRQKMPILSGILTFLAALARPEGIALGAAIGLAILLMGGQKKWKMAVIFAAVAGIPFMIYFAWRYSYYGYLFPNTYYAKVGRLSYRLAERGLNYLIRCMFGFIVPVLMVVAFLVVRNLKVKIGLGTGIQLIVILAMSGQIVLSGGDYLGFGRFYLPILPSAVMALIGLCKAMGMAKWNLDSWRQTFLAKPNRVWVKVACLIFVLNFFNVVFFVNHLRVIGGIRLTQGWEYTGKMLAQNTPQDVSIATLGIGAVGYFSGRTVIDVLGLTDETIAHTDLPTGSGYPGHEKYNTKYLLSRKPDIIMVCNRGGPFPAFECLCSKGKKVGGILDAANDIFANPALKWMYIYANLHVGDQYLSFYVLRDRLGKPGFENWAPAPDADQPCAKVLQDFTSLNRRDKIKFLRKKLKEEGQTFDLWDFIINQNN